VIGERGDRPVRHRVRLLPAAVQDLEEIVAYIGSDSEQAALAYGDWLLERIDGLGVLPRAYPEFPGTAGDIRYHTVGSHQVFFRIDASVQTVEVIRVLHAHRDPVAMLRILSKDP